jgi:hypothetical protein
MAAGVPLQDLDIVDPKFAKALRPKKSVIDDFNGYLKHANIGTGSVEEMGRRHMALYFSYRFKNRAKFNTAINVACPSPEQAIGIKPYVSASPTHQAHIAKTQACIIERLSCLGGDPLDPKFNPAQAANIGVDKIQANIIQMYNDKIGKQLNKLTRADVAQGKMTSQATEGLLLSSTITGGAAVGGLFGGYGAATGAVGAPVLVFKHIPIVATTLYEVAKSINVARVSPEIEHFFDGYIHDSMAGFIDMGMDEYMLNGIGIMKFRSVYKGNDWSVGQAVSDTAHDISKAKQEALDAAAKKAAELGDAAIKKYEAAKAYAKKKAQEVADYEEQKRHAAIDYASDKMTQADQYAREKAWQVKDAAVNTYDASIAEAKRVAAAAKKEADLLAEEARKKAEEAKQKAQEAANYGKKVTKEAGAAAGRGFELFWDGFKWVTKQALEGVSAIKG